MVSMVIQIK